MRKALEWLLLQRQISFRRDELEFLTRVIIRIEAQL